MTRAQFLDLPWCDQEMYTEAIYENYAAEPEQAAELETQDRMGSDDGPLPDISALVGANVVRVNFGQRE